MGSTMKRRRRTKDIKTWEREFRLVKHVVELNLNGKVYERFEIRVEETFLMHGELIQFTYFFIIAMLLNLRFLI